MKTTRDPALPFRRRDEAGASTACCASRAATSEPARTVAGAARRRARPNAARAGIRLALALIVVWARPAAALDDWQFELGASTDNLSRGLDISNGQPSVHAAATWYPDSGLFAGLSGASIRAVNDAQTGVETVADVGYVWRASDEWSAQAMLADYRFVRVPHAYREDYDELVMTAGWRDRLYASVAFSPNTGFGPSRRSWAVSYDLTGRLPLVYGVSATAGIGWYDVQAELGSGYAYGDAGLSWQYRSLQFDVMYVATHASAQVEAWLGGSLVNRWVADAIWHF